MNRHERRKHLKVLAKQLDATIASRPCGGCTACCTALEVAELKKPIGITCVMVCENGCKCYPDRPPSCRAYLCGWKLGHGSQESRPDLCGILFSPVEGSSPVHPGAVVHEVWEEAFQDPANRTLMQEIASGGLMLVLIRRGVPWRILVSEDRAHRAKAIIENFKELTEAGALEPTQSAADPSQ